MEIIKKIEINRNIEDVWKVLGHDFVHPHKWASSVYHSEGHGKSTTSIECDERSCQTAIGNINEKLNHFSDSAYSLSVSITEGLPKPMKSGGSAWKLTKLSDEKTLLTFKGDFQFKNWAVMLQPFVEKNFNKMGEELTEDFKYYVETGKPHPRKLANDLRKSSLSNPLLSTFYLISCILGTFLPLYFVFGFIQENGGVDLSLFISELFSNKASGTFSSDLLFSSFVFLVFIFFDSKEKHGIPNILVFIGLNLTIGLSSALPLYLYFREKAKI